MNSNASDPSVSARRKAYLNVVLPLFLISVVAYIDRVNIGYVALTMNKDLGFDSRVFGLGAGIFFAGYFLFEIPGALIAERYSPRLWLARIMISWGVVSALMAFMQTAWQFYLLRFLLGAAYTRYYIRPSYLANFLKIQNPPVRDWVNRMDQRVNDRHTREEIADISRPVAC